MRLVRITVETETLFFGGRNTEGQFVVEIDREVLERSMLPAELVIATQIKESLQELLNKKGA